MLGSAASSASARQADRACGDVHDARRTHRVDVFRGNLSCRTAKSVARYVLSHGRASQGSPGTAPRGWSCAWGFAYEHGDSGGTETARGPENLQATVTPLMPVDPYATL
jgi:hypothetical protein